jgi:hypothetical protein
MSERDEMRKIFFESWRKHQEKLPLEPLEAELVKIILAHPEYHNLLADEENTLTQEPDEHNPFLHLSLHLGLHEQLATNRPHGIREIYAQLCKKHHDVHAAEHKIMECLAQILWDAQRTGKMPEEQVYLEKLKKL